VAEDENSAWLPIGEFARRTRLTPKALRIYDRVGLLSPADVDACTGYRRYDLAQVRTGQLIGLLRGADLGLAEIGTVLDAAKRGAHEAIRCLDALLASLGRRHADRVSLVRYVQATLREGSDSMFAIQTRHVPARRLMSVQRRLYAHETDGFVREAKAAFRRHLGATEPTGPFTLIFHGIVSEDSDGPIEAALGCPETVLPSDVVGIRTEPAHDEAYTTITKAQWAYPAILAAYDAVACSAEAKARPGSRLSCREVYVAEPVDIDEHELVCDIAFPLGERQVSTPAGASSEL
jgi:DNA-binding transcriptional MerR regulator